MPIHFDAEAALTLGRDVLLHEADAVRSAADRLAATPDFAQAVRLILN